jgi:hypothetical protein
MAKLYGADRISGAPSTINQSGGARRDRTDDLMLAKHALSQLSYGPLALAHRAKAKGFFLASCAGGDIRLLGSRHQPRRPVALATPSASVDPAQPKPVKIPGAASAARPTGRRA